MTLRWVPGWNGLTEPEAVEYVAAVEEADGEPLEFGVAKAINDFVLGCKNDGIWGAIKASCILAGARTLDGALVPLVGTAPTNNNFVSGDYNRETGLVGDGSTKYLDSNRNNNADPQNSQHVGVYLTQEPTGSSQRLFGAGASGGGRTTMGVSSPPNPVNFRSRTTNIDTSSLGNIQVNNLFAVSRDNASTFTHRANNLSETITASSETPFNGNIEIFRFVADPSNARLAFYSIGESLDLALLDARVTALITAIGAAIP